MVHFNQPQRTGTKPRAASNVSPLHQSGSTAMSEAPAFELDRRLYRLYEKLRACNPGVQEMVWALNVVLPEYGVVIRTCEDLEMFIEAVEQFEAEGLG